MQNEILTQLQNDPGQVVLFALRNNPQGVIARLQALGYPVQDTSGANAAFKQLYHANGVDGLKTGLQGVAIIQSNLTSDEMAALSEAGYRGGTRSASTSGSGNGAGWDFAGVLVQTLGNVAGSYFYSQNTAGGTPPTNTNYMPAPTQPNYLLWAGIALVVLVGLFLILRKKPA
jgi:LPXTG-motif cell wall-anchored protein